MIKLILWDWNGTLLNDMPAWYAAIRETFSAFGAQPPTLDEYFGELEGHDYWGLYSTRGITASLEELNRVYGKTYNRAINRIALAAAARQVLKELRRRGIMCGIISAQIPELFDPLFMRLKLAPYFTYCHYPVFAKAEKIKELVASEGIALNHCLYIGDTPSDIRSAHKAGATAVAYLNGYVPKFLVDAAKPDYTIRDLKELLTIVEVR